MYAGGSTPTSRGAPADEPTGGRVRAAMAPMHINTSWPSPCEAGALLRYRDRVGRKRQADCGIEIDLIVWPESEEQLRVSVRKDYGKEAHPDQI
jgi:hypothetical protein